MPNWAQYNRGLIYPENRFFAKTYVTNAIAKTLFSTPLQIIPATAGWVIIPLLLHIRKLAGAYTLNGATKFQLRWTGTGGNIMSVGLASFADQAGELTTLGFGPGAGGFSMYSDLGVITPAVGNGINLNNDIANLSGNGGDLEVTVLFSAVPLVMSFSA